MKAAYTVASGIYGGVAVLGFVLWLSGSPTDRYAVVAGVACFVACLYSALCAAKEQQP